MRKDVCQITAILSFFFCVMHINGQQFTLTIEVLDNEMNLPLESAEILITPCSCGGITNAEGKFVESLPGGSYEIRISYIGYKDETRKINLSRNVQVVVPMIELQEQLSEVIVRAKRINDNLELPQMGAVQLEIRELNKIPAGLGEPDVLKGLTLMAGVNNAGDISNGLSVRGGTLDQNLILFDNAPIFNPTHLFGLFSVFTPDILASVDLYRANIPSRYGGRISSVVDIKAKNPYVDNLRLSGGIGLVSSRILVETPVIKNKLMMSLAGRAGLTGFLLPVVSKELKDTRANFYDATIKLLYLPTKDDQLSFTGFYSKDFYQLDLVSKIQDINSKNNQYDFKSLNGTINWRHTFENQINLRTYVVMSNYSPKTIFPEVDTPNKIEFKSSIDYASFATELSKEINKDINYYFGAQAVRYHIRPGNLDPGFGNNVDAVDLPEELSYEFGGYTNLNATLMKNVAFSAGLRFNHFVQVGPYVQARFDDISGELLSEVIFEKGDGVKTYNSLEPRFGVNIPINSNTSVKVSYARLNQYLQNIYNATTPLPTSRWKTADPFIKPQISDTYGLGLYKNLENNNYELGLEGYFRSSKNNLTYKPGANFFLEEFIERDLVQGQGQAYGIEFFIKKQTGKINGWFNYTWSRSLLRSENQKLADRINNNQWYASDFDRPHILNSTVNFEGDKYNTWSINFTAQSGRPYTVANSIFDLGNIEVPIFRERNNARLKPYHRLDFSWKVKYSKKLKRRWVGDWTFTVYNVLSRRNTFNLYYTQREPGVDADVFLGSPLGSYELAIMNSPLLALTYNFVFD